MTDLSNGSKDGITAAATATATATATELESELRIILENNIMCAVVGMAVCAILCCAMVVSTPVSSLLSVEILVGLIWLCVFFGGYHLNSYFLFNPNLGEEDKIGRWWRKKAVAYSVILPHQDGYRSRINKVQQLMAEEERQLQEKQDYKV